MVHMCGRGGGGGGGAMQGQRGSGSVTGVGFACAGWQGGGCSSSVPHCVLMLLNGWTVTVWLSQLQGGFKPMSAALLEACHC
jgi:hypothetical protein